MTATVLLLMGPTAVGKTQLAETLCDALQPQQLVRLINMDSAQVYRGMDIGTGKPGAAELARYPHALIDIRDPAEPYSAAAFVRDADQLVQSAFAAGALPVLVGGTMLYARAFQQGLADLPPADAQVRAAILADARELGWGAMHARLQAADPEAALAIHPNNHQRLQRALEVLELTGQPLSRWWRTQGDRSAAARHDCRVLSVGLLPQQRTLLHRRIERRFARMLDSGLIDEVAALRRRDDLHSDLPAMRSVGYRQVWQYLDGQLSRSELAVRGAAATRQLAKRQCTWLRGWPGLIELNADALLRSEQEAGSLLAGLAARILAFLAKSQAPRHSECD